MNPTIDKANVSQNTFLRTALAISPSVNISDAAMSSWLQLCSWHDQYALGLFPWDQWVACLTLPMPIYDLPRILDAAAAYDMAVHALHWPGGADLTPVRLTTHMARMMQSIGVVQHAQQVYMARALYAHCARYVTGVPRICDPPTYHVDNLPTVPYENICSLAHATLTPLPAPSISAWLDRTLRGNVYTPLRLSNAFRSTRTSGRRGRKHSCALEHKAVAEQAQQLTDDALRELTALAPLHVPVLACQVIAVAAGKLTLVLTAQPRPPCDAPTATHAGPASLPQ